MTENVWEEEIWLNPAQMQALMLPAKDKYLIYSRGTGKSYVLGAEVDENVRLMPRGVTTVAQATYGQALTKTLPSTFKMLESLGYMRYDPKTKQGDYVVCRQPPEGWYLPYEHLLSFEHCITFSNGHALYILTQDGNSRGPNADYNITDEALTIDKEKFDKEAAPTNRGNETIFGKLSPKPLMKHHGNTFVSSMPYEQQQKWLLDPAGYYEDERGVHLFDTWNKIVKLQMKLIDAKLADDARLFTEIWNECVRLRNTIRPFVSKNGTLFNFASVFDNIQNVGMSYILNQYKVMDRLSFMVEILNFIIETVDDCYYHFGENYKYYGATNDGYLRDKAENTDFSWKELASEDSRNDADCNRNQPLELSFDWGSKACFMEVAQESHFDWATKRVLPNRIVDLTINEFFTKWQDETDDTALNVLIDKFCDYYRYHANKEIHYFRDRYGDIRLANNKKSYNETAIDRLEKKGWSVIQYVHRGIEPPQHDKYLLWANITAENDERYPIKRFNASKCRYMLISMNNTRVRMNNQGKFEKDKNSERRDNIPPEEATHFGDVVDKRVWTKYGDILTHPNATFVAARV